MEEVAYEVGRAVAPFADAAACSENCFAYAGELRAATVLVEDFREGDQLLCDAGCRRGLSAEYAGGRLRLAGALKLEEYLRVIASVLFLSTSTFSLQRTLSYSLGDAAWRWESNVFYSAVDLPGGSSLWHDALDACASTSHLGVMPGHLATMNGLETGEVAFVRDAVLAAGGGRAYWVGAVAVDGNASDSHWVTGVEGCPGAAACADASEGRRLLPSNVSQLVAWQPYASPPESARRASPLAPGWAAAAAGYAVGRSDEDAERVTVALYPAGASAAGSAALCQYDGAWDATAGYAPFVGVAHLHLNTSAVACDVFATEGPCRQNAQCSWLAAGSRCFDSYEFMQPLAVTCMLAVAGGGLAVAVVLCLRLVLDKVHDRALTESLAVKDVDSVDELELHEIESVMAAEQESARRASPLAPGWAAAAAGYAVGRSDEDAERVTVALYPAGASAAGSAALCRYDGASDVTAGYAPFVGVAHLHLNTSAVACDVFATEGPCRQNAQCSWLAAGSRCFDSYEFMQPLAVTCMLAVAGGGLAVAVVLYLKLVLDKEHDRALSESLAVKDVHSVDELELHEIESVMGSRTGSLRLVTRSRPRRCPLVLVLVFVENATQAPQGDCGS
ncbi:hypothetical protein DIPPA_06488 [Diplonema papillatum]|nr:hypothetical protein DIPPA_06488 [Diplonema papillatum]